MITALNAKPIKVDTTKYTNFITYESKNPKALNIIPTNAYDKANVSTFIPISTNGDNPRSVKLNWNNQKISLINSPVNSSRNDIIPVTIRIKSFIDPIADLILSIYDTSFLPVTYS